MSLKHKSHIWALAGLLAACVASCSAPKPSMSYFENLEGSEEFLLAQIPYDVRITPDDRLAINVSSAANPTAAMAFSAPTSFTQTVDTRSGLALVAPTHTESYYVVSPKGDINFPVLGTLHVAGMTLQELTDYLTVRISQEIEDPVVSVALDNFTVNVLGEVKKPGKIEATDRRFSILDAIASAEDMTPYAVRDSVMLIREEDGKRVYHQLNLEDKAVLNSPYYYLQPNDVIIVKPNEVQKSIARYDTNKSYKVQVTSAIISACSVVASLVIALAIK